MDPKYSTLKELIDTPSPSGYEAPAAAVFKKNLHPTVEIHTDVMGNTTGSLVKKPNTEPPQARRVMLAGHIDQTGLQVRHIGDKGEIYMAAIGGVDAHLTAGNRLRVHTRTGTLIGIVGRKPIHLTEGDERTKIQKLDDQVLDLGIGSPEKIKELVAIGDPITFDSPMDSFGVHPDHVCGAGFDDKAGVYVIQQVLNTFANNYSGEARPVSLHGVATVQEEIGCRGAVTSTHRINPDVAIALDVTFGTCAPGIDARRNGETKLGAGPVIYRGPNINPVLFDLLVETAKANNIPYQVASAPGATGTDARSMQLARDGAATALISIPTRYIHSPNEVIHLGDLDATINLLNAAMPAIAAAESFIPN